MASDSEPWVDPDMQKAFLRMAEIAREHDLPADRSQLTPEQARRRGEIDRAWWNQERPALARIEDLVVDGPKRPILVRLLYPSPDRADPGTGGTGRGPGGGADDAYAVHRHLLRDRTSAVTR